MNSPKDQEKKNNSRCHKVIILFILSALFSFIPSTIILRSISNIYSAVDPKIEQNAKTKIFSVNVTNYTTEEKCNKGWVATNNTHHHHHPLAVVSEGCSGSSAVMQFVKRILRAEHNITFLINHSELFKPEKNPCYEYALETLKEKRSEPNPNFHDVTVEAIKRFNNFGIETNRTLFFKATIHQLHGKMFQGLKKIGALFGLAYRGNYLDRAICEARDCFGAKYGYPVFAENGTRTDLCFQRRKLDPSIKVKAYIHDIPNLIQKIHGLERHIRKGIQQLRFSEDVVQATEDLFAYEYTSDEKEFLKSHVAWMKFLSFTMFDIKKDTLTNIMRENQNSRKLKPHSDVIQNIEEVTLALQTAKPSLSHFLRR